MPLAVTLAAVLWCLAPSLALAASLVSPRSAISDHEARHLLARLYSYSEATLVQAEAEYRRLVALTPANSELSLELAEVLLRLGREDEAQKLYHTLDQNDPRVAGGLGDAFFASGRMAEAAAAYQRARDAGSQRPDLGLRLAQAMAWSGQAERAAPLLSELHAQHPTDVEISLLYSRVLAQTGDTRRARAMLDQLAALAPDNAALLYELADLEAAQGHASAARKYAMQAVKADDTPQARLRLAQFMNLWGAFQQSASIRREYLATQGPDPQVTRALAEALASAQRYEEAEGVLRVELMVNPDDTAARLALARVKLQEKNGRAALVVLDPLAKAGSDSRVEALRAQALTLLGRYAEAASIWRRLAHDDPATLVELGRVLERAGDTQAAKDVFDRAHELDPEYPPARYHAVLARPGHAPAILSREVIQTETKPDELTLWADLFSRDGYHAEALSCLETALRHDPEFFPARMALAENLAYARRFGESLKLLDGLATDFPDSSKILLTRARVLAWDRRYDESIAAFEALHAADPADPVPLREMARAAFWDKRAQHASEIFDRMLEPPVDELLAERLEEEMDAGRGDVQLARAAALARRSAYGGGIFLAYADLSDTDVARTHPMIFAELLPLYRIQHATDLERRAKLAAFNRRFAPAMNDLTALTDLRPDNQEAWFDLAQTQCALGLCEEEAATYERLLEIDPQHSLAGQALERNKRRSAPWLRAGVNLWEEKGRGNLANMVRLRNDLQVSLPVQCSLRLDMTAHRWQEMPQGPSTQYSALGGTLGFSGVFNEWFSGQASWTAKRFGAADPKDTDQYRTRLELNLRNAARLGFGYERVDEVANRFALLKGTQSDHFLVDARVPAGRRLDVEASARHIEYSDSNSGEAAHLAVGYALTDHPRMFKVILRGDYRHTRHHSQEIDTAGTLTDIIHPYWTPQGYLAGSATLEWYADLADDFFCGAKQHFVDVRLTGATGSDANNSIQLEAEWVLDITDHWGIEARGLMHRSPEWNANGFWTGVRYGF
ncbi:tetratricopeptide repeat protein [Pseudodesulfovibrio pelocollis]|uniref:tetratricopeptide repeat protein n=1 Tax=Pseudodesulfovibrio pelocollis TaxID=3051432 RepID=UPI00255B3F81|nr:tetratricopeptide repeat protein [Pseudodesulfovibrio sp. SB368]